MADHVWLRELSDVAASTREVALDAEIRYRQESELPELCHHIVALSDDMPYLYSRPSMHP